MLISEPALDLAAGITIAKSTGEVPGGNGARNLDDDDMEALAKAPDVTDITPLLIGAGVLHNGARTPTPRRWSPPTRAG